MRRYRRKLGVKEKLHGRSGEYIDSLVPKPIVLAEEELEDDTGIHIPTPSEAINAYGNWINKPLALVTPNTATTVHKAIERQRRPYRQYPTPQKLFQDPDPMPTARKRQRVAAPSRFRSTLGRRPGKFGSRKHSVNNGTYAPFLDKALNSFRLVEINHGTDESQISQRRGDLVNVKGVKLRMWFRFQSDVGLDAKFTWPYQIRWAIVNPKNNNGGTFVPSSDFFIANNPTTKVSRDFPGTGNWFDYMTEKINREEYGVLQQGSFIMAKDTTQTVSGTVTYKSDRQGWKLLDIWVPINKQMKFNSTTSAFPDVNLYFVWWFDIMGYDGTAQVFTTLAGSPLEQFHMKKIYFSNSAMYT